MSSSSRKKQRLAAASPSPDSATERSASPENGVVMQSTPGLLYAALPELIAPSAAYTAQIKQLAVTRRAVEEELIRIADSAKRAGSGSSGNVWETPAKRLLSAQMELARMDYMESASVAALLHRASHFTEGEAEDRARLESTDEWKEAQHVLALYEELRRNLVVRTGRRKSRRSAVMLGLELLLTILYVPLFALSIVLCMGPMMSLWSALGVRNHYFPVDLIQKLYARSFLALCGVRVRWHGLDNLSDEVSTIGMFSHASNLDPFIVASGPLAFKWIGKKSLFRIPVIGWLLTGLQHIAIEREVREKAIASLQRAAQTVLKHKRCIAVSPEGTRSRTGRMADFKKGAFHTALQVGAPVTPLLIEGAYDLWPSGSVFAQPGVVHVHVLEPIPIVVASKDGAKDGDTYNSLASKVRRRFLEALAKSARESIAASQPGADSKKTKQRERGEGNFHFILASLFMPLCYAVFFLVARGIFKAI